jgi:hypothetical protein
MTEMGTCDIFTTAEQEPPVPVYRTYKCGYCNEPADPSLMRLAAHWWNEHGIVAQVVR